MTLRQEIAEIGCEAICGSQHIDIGYCKGRLDKLYCPDCAKVVDRICEAIGKAAEGMPEEHISVNTFCDMFSYNQGALGQYHQCQAYWQKEIKEEIQ